VGQRTDFDKLYMEIETDGTIDPEEAFTQANAILVEHFNLIDKGMQDIIGGAKTSKESKQDEDKLEKSKGKNVDSAELLVEEMKLSTRTVNALTAAHIKTAAGLAKKSEKDLSELEGLGEKGIKEIKRRLKKLGLELRIEAE